MMPHSHASSCLPCTGNTFASGLASTTCFDCPTGQVATSNNTACHSVSAQHVQCTQTLAHYRNVVCALHQCAPGYAPYASINLVCGQCDEGTYKSAAGLQECSKCPSGRYAPSRGQTVCDP